MARSMTGFGRGEAPLAGGGRLVVEAKAVNHRFAEVVIRSPRQLAPLEEQVRRQITGRLARGRIEVFITWEQGVNQVKRLQVDKELALQYYRALKELGEAIGSKSEISVETVAKMPDVLTVADTAFDPESVWPQLSEALGACLDGLIAMREREGESLTADLAARLSRLIELRQAIAERAPQIAPEYRARLTKRLDDLLAPGAVDPQRLATEVALFADRADISEELERLQSHFGQFRKTLSDREAVGRKLDFLVQELGREINTIGSKAQDATITNWVVEAKGELEKMREQVQNIE